MKDLTKTDGCGLPRHIGIIMDGNGRWAKSRLLPRSAGHKAGVERMLGLLEHGAELGIGCMTVFAFSTENFSRPADEVEGIFNLFRTNFDKCIRRLAGRKVRVKVLGDVGGLPEDIGQMIAETEAKSPADATQCVNIALNYGSRAEIVRAANLAVEKGEKVNEESFSSLLYTAGQPELDLLIRTGKEIRLSNFLLWQAAYAELYFSEKMFPDFSDRDLDEAIREFSLRHRRFGSV